MTRKPPRLARLVMRLLPLGARRCEIEADLDDVWQRKARPKYWREIRAVARWSLERRAHMGMTAFKEGIRMTGLIHDLRHAVRTCSRTPMVSLLSIGAFALGIGVATAMFSVFFHVLLKPLPYPEPERIVAIFDTLQNCPRCPASLANYHDWRTRSTSFSTIGGSIPISVVLSGSGEPAQLRAVRATASLANVFGVPPAHGRWFLETEDTPGGPRVAVLSHSIWVSHFGRDASVVGKTVALNEESYEVIGIMPPDFTHRLADVFVPLAASASAQPRASRSLATYARMKPGVTTDQALAEMRSINAALVKEFGGDHGIELLPYQEVVVGSVRTPLQVLLAAVGVVLLISCANVSNLLLASGLARRQELGIRLALGARVGDIARQLAAEGLLLAAVGGLAGVLLASLLVDVFVVLAGSQLPRSTAIAIDGRVLLCSLGLTTAAGLACGLWPLVRLRAHTLVDAVRSGTSRTATADKGHLGTGLVAAEIALAFVLLVTGGLLLKNLHLLQARDVGLESQRVLTFDISPAGPRYNSRAAVADLFTQINTRLGQLGGVEAVGTISHLPMYRFGFNGPMQREGDLPAGVSPTVEFRWFSGDYFRALQIPLIEGRLLDRRDHQTASTVVINRAMAERFWPGESALGKRFGQGQDRSRWFEVVGVVGDVRSYGVARDAAAEFYQPLERGGVAAQTVVVRVASDDLMSVLPAARSIVGSLDPVLPVSGVQTMEDVIASTLGQQTLVSAMATLFAALAGLLAVLGVFGIMTFNVRQQRHELGIRLALGADGGALRRLIAVRGLRVAVVGTAVGAVAAWWLVGLLATMLNDVQPTDVVVFAGTAVAVIGAALLATWWPARSAGRTDPMIVLRNS